MRVLIEDLARELDARVEGDCDTDINGVAPLDEAGPGQLGFLAHPKYRSLLTTTRASAVIVGEDEKATGSAALLRVADPYLALVKAAAFFDARPRPAAGIHPTAVIDPSASLGQGASVGAYAVVGAGTVIGGDATLHPHVTVYPGVRIGERFTAHAGAVVRECVVIGDDVTLQPGSVVGGDGFGFVPAGKELPVAIPQIGGVELADHVDVGANSTIDRAAVGLTRVGAGTKLDNLVMVAHGCRLGDGVMMAGQSGLAGSARVGDRTMIGGQSGVSGHVSVGSDVQVASKSAVLSDLETGSIVAGIPAVAIAVWRRYALLLSRLPELFRRSGRPED